ncbi:MAG: hypothetical protein ACI915_005383 [Gammaproteobacteria bacterium]
MLIQLGIPTTVQGFASVNEAHGIILVDVDREIGANLDPIVLRTVIFSIKI